MPSSNVASKPSVAAGVLTFAVLGVVGAAAPAQAAPPQPYGTVVANGGLNERQYPSTDSHIFGALPEGAQVGLYCKVRAQYINGNTLWYLERNEDSWLAARYVVNTGYVPYCEDVPVR